MEPYIARLISISVAKLSVDDLYILSQLTQINAYGIVDINVSFPKFKNLIYKK